MPASTRWASTIREGVFVVEIVLGGFEQKVIELHGSFSRHQQGIDALKIGLRDGLSGALVIVKSAKRLRSLRRCSALYERIPSLFLLRLTWAVTICSPAWLSRNW